MGNVKLVNSADLGVTGRAHTLADRRNTEESSGPRTADYAKQSQLPVMEGVRGTSYKTGKERLGDGEPASDSAKQIQFRGWSGGSSGPDYAKQTQFAGGLSYKQSQFAGPAVLNKANCRGPIAKVKCCSERGV